MLAAVLAVAALAGCRKVPAPCEVGTLQETTRFDVPETVRYCRPANLPIRSATAQVLVDASGSMRGLTGILGAFREWNQQALSQVRSHGMEWREQRFCFFSAATGLAPCANGRFPSESIPAGGNTNLDQAINEAGHYDLTVILTDGVAATVKETKDCAGGVDPACVARSLLAAIKPSAGTSQDTAGGLWMVPMAALHQGPYYTERVISPDSFQPRSVEEAVRRDTAGVATAGKPYKDGSGRLAYEYNGPRALIALVIAKNAELGRAYVSALAARRAAAQIEVVSSLREFQTGFAMMPPVEIYPGYVPSVIWEGAKKALREDGQEAECGAMSVSLDPKAGMLRLGPTGDLDEAIVELRGKRLSQVAECTDLRQLPVLQFKRSDTPGHGAISAAQWKSVADPAVQLHVVSTKDGDVPCDDSAPVVRWRAAPDFAASADRMASTDGKQEGPVNSLASTDPVSEPHRIYGLREMLEKFYRESLQARDPVSSAFAEIRICQSR